MKQKQDGKGRDMLTNHAKIKPEETSIKTKEALKKLIHKNAMLATKAYEEQTDK